MKKILNYAKQIIIPALIIGFSLYIDGAEPRSLFWVRISYVVSALLLINLGSKLWRGCVRYRALTRDREGRGGSDQLAKILMPAWLYPYFITEKKIYAAFWRAIRGKPFAVESRYSVVNGNKYVLFVPLLILVAIVDVPIFAFVATLIIGSSHLMYWVDGVLGFGTVYGIIWVIGDQRNIKESGHLASSAGLSFKLGVRCSGSVGIETVGACEEIVGSFKAFCKQNAIPIANTWIISPLDAPNVLIELKQVTSVEMTRFGYRRSVNIKFIALYVDRPGVFVKDVAAALASCPVSFNDKCV